MRDAVIVAACRTAVGRSIKGSFKDTRPDDLAAAVVKGAYERTNGIKPEDIDDVIMGCAMPEAEQGMNVARIAVFRAGLPDTVPAMTVNRFCSSGIQTIAIAAMQIQTGISDIIIAGGVESMTMVPMGGLKPCPNPWLAENYPAAYTAMGNTAEIVAEDYNLTREEMDKFALDSHMKAIEAIKSGKFKDEIIPYKTKVYNQKEDGTVEVKEITFDTDECPRPDSTLEGMAKLKSPFKAGGNVTAASSSPLNDGAAAVCIMAREKAEELGLEPMATFAGYQVAGLDPARMGLGPIYAVKKLKEKYNLNLDEIDLFEVNEAFAAQSIPSVRELGLPLEKVNVNGGAIALGHPLGATGAILTVKMMYEMKRRDAKKGIVTMCIGGGMGAAGLFVR